ncbi:hypothetical protein EDD17DRAFT_646008 [Pisolithus thermaeus]|nr:hypothetical protein EV401DRAFT_1923531 [Pisolithus croceorrhizus]KAI6161799.1 hypothetical protein EDD17DRAFT_646008 [Pisolithus thermaeus]
MKTKKIPSRFRHYFTVCIVLTSFGYQVSGASFAMRPLHLFYHTRSIGRSLCARHFPHTFFSGKIVVVRTAFCSAGEAWVDNTTINVTSKMFADHPSGFCRDHVTPEETR